MTPDSTSPTAEGATRRLAAPSQRHVNHLLAALPPAVWQGLRLQLQSVALPLGEVLYESGVALRFAYFPTTAIASLMYVTENGASFEVASVGNEGLVGVPLFMGGGSTPSRAVVRHAGHAWRLPGQVLKDAFRTQPPLALLLLRYTQALITQTSQLAVCNRHHSIDQRLCLWLLQTLDRLPGDALPATQALMAHALGVRRESVTEAMQALQRAGLIGTRRGQIEVLDRAGLEQRVCECYAVVRREYDRLLPR